MCGISIVSIPFFGNVCLNNCGCLATHASVACMTFSALKLSSGIMILRFYTIF